MTPTYTCPDCRASVPRTSEAVAAHECPEEAQEAQFNAEGFKVVRDASGAALGIAPLEDR